MAGCLLTSEQELPAASVTIEAEIIAAESVSPEGQALPCFGFDAGSASPAETATRFSLTDSAGKAWTLWFPTGLVQADHFPPGATLEVEYHVSSFTILSKEHRLVVREGNDVALFVDDGTRLPPIPGVDLTQRLGELACPWTGGACSTARSHTLMDGTSESVTDPCGSTLSGFSVSSLSQDAAGHSCGGMVCDIASRYFAAGVRIR